MFLEAVLSLQLRICKYQARGNKKCPKVAKRKVESSKPNKIEK
jgi:hypothetical protein